MKLSLLFSVSLLIGSLAMTTFAQDSPAEGDFYKIVSVPTPEGILLEVGGITTLPDGRVAIATRRGDVWMVENPCAGHCAVYQ